MDRFRCQGCGRRVYHSSAHSTDVVCRSCGAPMRQVLVLPFSVFQLIFLAALVLSAIYIYSQIDWRELTQGIDWDSLLRGSDGSSTGR